MTGFPDQRRGYSPRSADVHAPCRRERERLNAVIHDLHRRLDYERDRADQAEAALAGRTVR